VKQRFKSQKLVFATSQLCPNLFGMYYVIKWLAFEFSFYSFLFDAYSACGLL